MEETKLTVKEYDKFDIKMVHAGNWRDFLIRINKIQEENKYDILFESFQVYYTEFSGTQYKILMKKKSTKNG